MDPQQVLAPSGPILTTACPVHQPSAALVTQEDPEQAAAAAGTADDEGVSKQCATLELWHAAVWCHHTARSD
jgi:hypothetical protein